MSSSNVKPIAVRVVDADGHDLGAVTVRPTGGNWRVLEGAPSVRVGDRTARCEWDGQGWLLKLRAGESKPGSRKGGA